MSKIKRKLPRKHISKSQTIYKISSLKQKSFSPNKIEITFSYFIQKSIEHDILRAASLQNGAA
jgi:hypothetical protein